MLTPQHNPVPVTQADLRPCPFCGSHLSPYDSIGQFIHDAKDAEGCLLNGFVLDDPDDCAFWNTRIEATRPDDGQWERATGYSDAFYQIGEMLGIPAQSKSPAEVWATQMRPMLERAIAALQPAPVDQVEALREKIIAARNFLAINEPEHADRHLKDALAAMDSQRKAEGGHDA